MAPLLGVPSTTLLWRNATPGAGAIHSINGVHALDMSRLWRSLKYECVYLHAWETGSQAKAGVGRWINFYNHQRPHAIRRENSLPDCFLILLKHGGQPPAVVYFNATQTDQQVQAVA